MINTGRAKCSFHVYDGEARLSSFWEKFLMSEVRIFSSTQVSLALQACMQYFYCSTTLERLPQHRILACVCVRCQQSHAHGKEFLGASARVRPHFTGFASSSSKLGSSKSGSNLENPGPGSYLSIEASYSNACLVANANVKGTNALVCDIHQTLAFLRFV